MACKGYCGGTCGECDGCIIDESIPCAPGCNNLTEDGKNKVLECVKSGCDQIAYIFDMEEATGDQIIERYGEIAEYPYSILTQPLFTSKELMMLSDGLLSLIQNACEAIKLLNNQDLQDEINDYIKVLQSLNQKVCMGED